MLIKNKISVQLGLYKPLRGSYGKPVGNSLVTWTHCRNVLNIWLNVKVAHCLDQLDLVGAEKESAFFIFTLADIEKVDRLLSELEERLGLLSNTHIQTTTSPSAYIIEPSKFWYTSPIRLSFLTNFIRWSLIGRDNLLKLYDDLYFKKTSDAVDLFLSGHTLIPELASIGWFDYFYKRKHLANLLDVNSISLREKQKIIRKFSNCWFWQKSTRRGEMLFSFASTK